MVSSDKIMARISVVGTWKDVLEAQRKVKKFGGSGLYLEVEQLAPEYVKESLLAPAISSWFKGKFTTRLVMARARSTNVDHFSITLRGPKIISCKAPQFIIVQVNAEGVFTPSRPLSREEAELTFKSARGVLSYLCEVKGAYDTRGTK